MYNYVIITKNRQCKNSRGSVSFCYCVHYIELHGCTWMEPHGQTLFNMKDITVCIKSTNNGTDS